MGFLKPTTHTHHMVTRPIKTLNNSSRKVKCKERGSNPNILLLLHMCDEIPKFDRSCDGMTHSCGHFNKPHG